ncbi:uncharacterized protein LOC141587181 [Silene latifolia]|uniref:uncharacterized protein LOC141587181 n=1 Tax=Silene latifolia TaxID=37657 RepID=UPI003D77176B
MAAAASSPAISNNGSETTADSGGKTAAVPSVLLQRSDPSKNLRGLNKPKCITCGNVARSRCPFQCCKSCCSKAQNPCHIHVLKPNATLADRGATANSAPPEQRPNEGAAPLPPAKVTSIRQLSNTFSQFNNVHTPARSRKPLSMKEALVINEWRFAKLKEYKESNIEAENDAFDRYMQNINLLEEVFDVNSERLENNSQLSNLPTTSGEKADIVSEMKAKLRSNPGRINTFKKRTRQTVDQGLRNLQFYESNDGSGNLDNEDDPTPKAAKNWWAGNMSSLTALNEKLNRAQTVEDIKRCIQVRAKNKGQAKLTSQKETECTDISKEMIIPKETSVSRVSEKPLLKFVRATEIDQNSLNGMEFYFSSREEIEDL